MFGARSQVVPSERSARMNESGEKWQCDNCGHLNAESQSHCSKCSQLPKEERAMRQIHRSEQGLGRGGGFFERDQAAQRDTRDLAQAKNGLDIYGRRKEVKGQELKDSKADRQKAALDRLRHRSKELSPPRPSHFRERSSRSRSMKRKRETKRVFNFGR